MVLSVEDMASLSTAVLWPIGGADADCKRGLVSVGGGRCPSLMVVQ